jgi:hypothetical protein
MFRPLVSSKPSSVFQFEFQYEDCRDLAWWLQYQYYSLVVTGACRAMKNALGIKNTLDINQSSLNSICVIVGSIAYARTLEMKVRGLIALRVPLDAAYIWLKYIDEWLDKNLVTYVDGIYTELGWKQPTPEDAPELFIDSKRRDIQSHDRESGV